MLVAPVAATVLVLRLRPSTTLRKIRPDVAGVDDAIQRWVDARAAAICTRAVEHRGPVSGRLAKTTSRPTCVLGAVVRQDKGGRMAQHLQMQRDADYLRARQTLFNAVLFLEWNDIPSS